jgi:electron transfer flavoprotein beta subunit
MNIVVCVKQVPDTASDRKLSSSDNTLERAAADPWMNELDEFGIEAALQIIEKEGGEVTVLTIGPEKAADTIRKALPMGAGKAVHVSDDALHGSDAGIISEVIAKAASRIGFDLLILGSEATDAKMGIMAAMVSERLGLPQLSYATKITTDGKAVTINRLADYGYDTVEATTPAVVSVVEKINEPRYPSFKGIMAAKKKPVEKLTLADLEIDPASVGLAASDTEVISWAARPPRQAGTVVTDEGEGGKAAAEFLVSGKFI